ncbi:carboxynorspermidine decarboxylase [Bacteroidota bacterium]
MLNKIASPAYVIDMALLRKNLELIQYVQEQSGATIILAFKGFSTWGTFPLVRKYVKGATASSLYEARLCFEEMGSLAYTYSPAYHPADFKDICSYSGHIVFNSIQQLAKYYKETQEVGHQISCGLRVNPEYSVVETDLYNPCALGSRLGMKEALLPKELPKEIEGLHFHVLCESSAENLVDALVLFEEKFSRYFHQLKWVNFGGGHLMTRKGYNVDLLINTLRTFKEKYNLEVILEPGSAIAWETGVLISEVLDVVETDGISTAILDVSFTAHMPDTLEMPYRPSVRNAIDAVAGGKFNYRLGGVSCLAGDYMEAYNFGKPLNIGDRVIFEDMIHYTMVKTTMFNGVNHPDIVLLQEDKSTKVLKKYDYEHFKGRLG